MSTHKYMDRICVVAVVLSFLLTVVCMNGEALGIRPASRTMGYEEKLFDTNLVHTIDIVMDDWDSFIENCESEEYSVASVVVDGEAYKNVGIRAKGNTSLSSVSSMNSDRYSFKIEFDQYDSTKSYYGLDKLSLNNLIQDSTCMKDYLTYRLMAGFGVDAPLCSYVYITVNGEDWGLYLAVEGIEESFLQRNYGSDYGNLYKPDSTGFGGGRGNGRDFKFNMDDLMDSGNDESPASGSHGTFPGNFDPASATEENPASQMPEGMGPSENTANRSGPKNTNGMPKGGMGSEDVKLQYIDDDPDSYSNIFDNAKTDISTADQQRLIRSLKQLSRGENIEDVVDVDEVIRYFVVHNFVCNGDSYTGQIIHNYYLYEEDGRLSMIPWDYNLAFGTFQGSDATKTVNTPIDTPISSGSADDRPMLNWIFQSEEYTQLYHQYFAEFIEGVDFAEIIDATAEMIAPYVKKDPTAFYSYQEFKAGVDTLRAFCLFREESVEGQINGTIPATTSGQAEDSSALIDASNITLSDMGSMGSSGGGGFKPNNDQSRGPGAAPAGNTKPADFPKMPEESDEGLAEGEQSPENTVDQIPEESDKQEFSTSDSSGRQPGNNMPNDFAPQEGASGPLGLEADNQAGNNAVTLLAISAVVLLLGLLVAFKFRH